MNNEFKAKQYKDATVYTLESASGGSTGAGSVASVSMPMGGVRRRGDNLIAQEADKNTVPSTTPRNFVAKNAKMGGAGAHRDKKKEQKQGVEKHKKPYMEDHADAASGWGQGSYDTYAGGNHGRGVAENPEWYNDEANSMTTSQLKSLYKHAVKLRQAVKQMQAQGDTLEPWQQSKVTKAADYLDAVFNAVDDEHDMGEEQGVAEGLHPMVAADLEKLKTLNPVDRYSAYANIRGYFKADPALSKMASDLQGGYYEAEMLRSKYKTDAAKAKYAELEPMHQAFIKQAIGQEQGVAEGSKQDKDMTGQTCQKCKKDKYQERSQHDDMDGKVTCSCGNRVDRWKKYKEQGVAEEWSKKYKSSINCSHPKGFSQKAHCAGKKKHTESMMTMEAVCPDCGMCQTHGNLSEIKKGAKDSNGVTKCWPGHHASGTKKGKNGGQVRNCVPNEDIAEDPYFAMLERSVSQAQHNLMVGVAHNPQFAQKVKVKQKVGQEFAQADIGHDISKLTIRVPKKK